MKRSFTKLLDNPLTTVQIVLLISVSVVLRFFNLGYSNLQGDEILALCRFSNFETPVQFLVYLLGQRKGPLQFLVTCGYSLLDPTFSSELALRLPFALANLLALACFFMLVYRLFTLQIAIYSSFLLATNGIFIAFARIVQYQSLVILGGILGLLGLTLALKDEKWKISGLYIGFVAQALSLLAHFDAAFFLPPMAVLILHWWLKFRHQPDFARLRNHLIAAASISIVLVLAFYIPYALRLGSYQLSYWEERQGGESTNIFRLFQFYNPGPILWLCLLWVIVGLTRIRNSVAWQTVLAWLLPALIFMVLIFKDSRTHAYSYILPLFIIAGVGIDAMIVWLQTRFRGKSFQIAVTAALAIFLFFSYISYEIFIDRSPEYPWQPKQVLGLKFDGGYLTGTFGFPYNREWRDIGKWFQELPANEDVTLVSNEKDRFISFYLPSKVHYKLNYAENDFPGKINAPHGLYVLIVQQPQSWMDRLWGLSSSGWREKFVPLHDFVNEKGQVVASVYYLTLEDIQANFHPK